MGYTNCDACGRLFIKGKYCPICLKVYRDSEATPMVCCDKCEHWIHCQCDGISDEKYQEFQLDNDLHYICAVCRGDCSRVKDMEEATDEIWRRRDQAERDLILQYQAAAGVPSTEENMRLCPSDDESDLVEDRFPKKLAKPLPLKGSDRDKKPLKKLEGGKLKNEKLKKDSMSGGFINKLKITLPAGHAVEQRASDSLVEWETSTLEKVQKKKKKKDDSVVKLTKYMMQARESKAASNMKRDEVDQGASGVSFAEKDHSLAADGTSGNKFAKGLSNNQGKVLSNNEGNTSKLVNKEYKKVGTKLLLHVPAKQKGTQNKVKMKVRPTMATMPEDDSKDIESDKMYSDEDAGSDEPNVHVRSSLQSKYPEQMRVAAPRRMEGTYVNPGEISKHHRFKDVMQPYDLSRPKPDKLYLKGSCATMRHDRNEQLDSIDASSGKQGASFFSMRKREMEMEVTAETSQDEESSDVPRKKLRSSESVDTKDSLPTVPLKFRLKKPEGENGVNLDAAESPPSNHGNGNGVRGQRSKRKKHHLLEMKRMPEEDREVDSQSSEDNHGKEVHDSWVVQKHGRGTVDRRVDQDFPPRHKSWNRGMGEGPQPKLQSTMTFNGGRHDSGESMRMRSHSHKFSRH